MTSGKWSGKSATQRRWELPPNWPALRAAQLERDGYRCTETLRTSGERCPNVATDCDHVGSKWDHSNLRSLCAVHHAKKTALQGAQGSFRPPPRRRKDQHPGLL